MIPAIVDGIVGALRTALPDMKVYTEQVPQNFTEPCFSVRCPSLTNKPFLGNRYRRNNLFAVQYHPWSFMDANEECHMAQDMLYRILEYITVEGDLVRGTGMRGEIHDGVLTFFVNFNMFVRIEPETEIEPMEDFKIEETRVIE